MACAGDVDAGAAEPGESDMTKPHRFQRDAANIELRQPDGQAPEVLFSLTPEGEHSVGLIRVRFPNGARARGAGASHLIMLTLGESTPMRCRVGRQQLVHNSHVGNVTTCPAEVEFAAVTDAQTEALLIAVPPEPLALLAAERSLSRARLTEQLSGVDPELYDLARDLLVETMSGSSRFDLNAALFEHLAERYITASGPGARGTLSTDALARIHHHVKLHIGEVVHVDELADIAGLARTHFPRVFRRAMGMSPYQYVVRLRLEHALRLIRIGERPLADIAAATGFVDQSHLSNWVRRIHGTSPARLMRR